MLYKVSINEDVYLGTAEEVVRYMMRAEGAPAGEVGAYMVAMAARLAERLDVSGIDTSDETAFLESLREGGVVPVEVLDEPSTQRVAPEDAVGDGPVAYGPGVHPRDFD